ncbi:L-type lectin-domain containing receptor kinase IX.1-like [Cryptomeria japonica]|uniref:L-type lectin-domain containing receptor kinase IX.1-like n=1 Tax=Cryptomeria japonica TaxID=3369 RepID=UPI0027DAA33D|nr:L-type lectin-domain containing receptor kinase IX.1-like [Cryptomeria japonica]
MNSLSIPMFMAESARGNFTFKEFTRCNTSNILCVNDATISGHKIHLTNNTIDHHKVANETTGGLPGNGNFLDIMLAVKFSRFYRARVSFQVGSNYPIQICNSTNLNDSLNDGKLWNAHIDCNLGQGGFGGVYKGVKRLSSASHKGRDRGLKEFISEISIVSRVRHRNLVQLLGWCHEKGELLLVYHYMSNGSLDKQLFIKGDIPPLQWSHRYRIALEIASGLLYLHEEWAHCIVHRDVKSSNVMLDCNLNAKLGDFGLACKLEHSRLSQTKMAAGTLGYLAPECVIL